MINDGCHHNSGNDTSSDTSLLRLVHILEEACGKVAEAHSTQIKERSDVFRRASACVESSGRAVGDGAVCCRRARTKRGNEKRVSIVANQPNTDPLQWNNNGRLRQKIRELSKKRLE